MSIIPVLFIEPLPPRFDQSIDEAEPEENQHAPRLSVVTARWKDGPSGKPNPGGQVPPEPRSNVARIAVKSRKIRGQVSPEFAKAEHSGGNYLADAAHQVPVGGEFAGGKQHFQAIDDAIERSEQLANLCPMTVKS